jgi:hypothetical protein
MSQRQYTFKRLTRRLYNAVDNVYEDVEMRPTCEYPLQPTLLLVLEDAGDGGKEVTVPINLVASPHEDDEPGSSLMMRFSVSIRKTAIMMYSGTTPGKLERCGKVIRVDDEELAGCIDTIQSYSGPKQGWTGVLSLDIYSLRVIFTSAPYVFEYNSFLNMFEWDLCDMFEWTDSWCNGSGCQSHVLLTDDVQLTPVEVKFEGIVNRLRQCTVASDVAYVDKDLRVIYVLVSNVAIGRDERGCTVTSDSVHETYSGTVWEHRALSPCRVVPITYGSAVSTVIASKDDGIELTWNNDTRTLHVSITSMTREPGVATVSTRSLKASQLEESPASNLKNDFSIVPTYDMGMSDMVVGPKVAFPSTLNDGGHFKTCEEVRECFETYFQFLSHLRTEDSPRRGSPDKELVRKMWKNRMKYGPIARWDLSRLKDLSGLFQGYVFPFHVDVLDLSLWSSVFGLRDVSKMFYGVKNVDEVRLPLLYMDTDGSVSMDSMFRLSDVRKVSLRVSVGFKTTLLRLTSMFKECRKLETVNLEISVCCNLGPLTVNLGEFAEGCCVLDTCSVRLWRPYRNDRTAIYVQNAIRAFSDCESLRNVAFPGGLNRVGGFERGRNESWFEEMFACCRSLPLSVVSNVLWQLRVFEYTGDPHTFRDLLCNYLSVPDAEQKRRDREEGKILTFHVRVRGDLLTELTIRRASRILRHALSSSKSLRQFSFIATPTTADQ